MDDFTVIDANGSSALNDSASLDLSATQAGYTPYSQRLETYLVPVVFLFIFVSGIIGNITLIAVLIKEQLIKTPSYLYILNLSLGDLSVILGTVPFVCTIYTFESWPYGEIVCKVSEFTREMSIGVSVLTLSAMSWDRYRAAFSTIIRPNARQQQQSMASVIKSPTVLTMIAIWLVSISFAGPTAYFSFIWNVEIQANTTIAVCYPFPPELGPWYPKAVVLIKCVLYYVVPLTIIACCYISIAVHLITKARNISEPNGSAVGGNEAKASNFRQRSSRKSLSRAKIILFLVIIFMVCFFPHNLFMVWFYFNPNSKQQYNDFWHFWRIAAFCLTFLNSCLNPITLYLTSDQFKQLFNKYLLSCCQQSGLVVNVEGSGENLSQSNV